MAVHYQKMQFARPFRPTAQHSFPNSLILLNWPCTITKNIFIRPPVDYTLLDENALRQQIDSMTVFREHRRVQTEARNYRGGMYWKKQDGYEYLVKTSPDNRQTRLGPRSEQNEAIYETFRARKEEVESRLKSIAKALDDAQRMNKALRVGRAPALLVNVLTEFEEAGLSEHFTVVGTHALYGYEAAAGVRFTAGALATHDVDMLWDARKYVRFIADMKRLDVSVLGILQRADSSFRRKEGENATAINDKGFEVDFLRREQEGKDPHPVRFSEDVEDLWPMQARRANLLTQAPRFSQVVTTVTGRMALMHTIDPNAFVQFKRWLAKDAPDRPAVKRRRDELQARSVQALLDEQLLMP